MIIFYLKKKTSDIFDFERKRKVMLKGNGSINESLEQQYELTFIISDLFLFFLLRFLFKDKEEIPLTASCTITDCIKFKNVIRHGSTSIY